MGVLLVGLLGVVSAWVVPAATSAGAEAATTSAHHSHRYSATITYTQGGIPHILARTFGDAGYGYGYAFARDNICVMADDYVTVEGQRSRYFGPSAGYTQRGNGVSVTNLDSDIFWTEVQDSGIVERLRAERPPLGPGNQLRSGVRGYVAGYNRYLRDVGGAAGIRDPACHGEPWVRPITVRDAYLRFYQLCLLASSDVLIPGIAAAAPPATPAQAAATMNVQRAGRLIAEGWRRAEGDLGSNAVAIGKAGMRDHTHGLLLGNPHFPWIGPERFFQAQIEVPGVVNVTGASLFGVPLVLIGHNRWIAWSHTVSTAFRFTPYQLTVVPAHPTEYLYNGKILQMQPRRVSVAVKGAGGTLTTIHHTTWWTRYGPVITSIEGIPLPWTAVTAFTFRDANATNFRIFNHFLKTDEAHSAHQELHILKTYQGIPWVNTIVTDDTGHALYADIGTIPAVSDRMVAKCDTALGTVTFKLIGLPVLDGSRSACNWANQKGAAVPGIFAPRHEPYLWRNDYVTNSNDSFWLSNPHHPLTGFARIIGDVRTPRSLRTRIGLIMTQDRVSGIGEKKGFTLQAMTHEVFSNRQYAGELWRNGLVSLCNSFNSAGVIPDSSGVVPVGGACSVLAKWDLHENARSRGAILFRRFLDHLFPSGTAGSVVSDVGLAAYWKNPFEVSDPVHTPNGLNTLDPQVPIALGDAIHDLDKAHLPLGVPVERVQGVERHGHFIPIQGGEADPNGEFNAISAPWTGGTRGEGNITEGSSFVQVVTWQGHNPCPVARTILTYSESTDPTNPHYDDQTKMFSKKRWVHDRFCTAAISSDPHKRVLHLSGT